MGYQILLNKHTPYAYKCHAVSGNARTKQHRTISLLKKSLEHKISNHPAVAGNSGTHNAVFGYNHRD